MCREIGSGRFSKDEGQAGGDVLKKLPSYVRAPRALTGSSHGDGAGAVPGFSSTQGRMERMTTEERRRLHSPSKPQHADGGALGTCGGRVAGPVSPKEERP